MVIATLMSVLIHRPVIASLTPPGTELRRPYCVSDAIRLHPKQRNTLIRGLHPIAGSLPTGCISAWQFSHSRISRTR
jgi:hypothetical protein